MKRLAKLCSMLLTVALITVSFLGCGNTGSSTDSSKDGSADSSAESATDATTETAADTSSDTTADTSTETAADAVTLTDEDITLTFWHAYGDAEEAQLKDVVLPMWEKLHPNIHIEAVRQSNEYHETIVASFGTGQSPDVARIDATNTASYADLGGIAALDSFAGFTESKDQYLSGPLSTNIYNGSYYGLPLDTNCKAAVVNKTVLETIGLTEVPATMEEFLAAAEKSDKPLLNVSSVGDWDFCLYVWLFGGTITDENFTKASGYLDSQATIDAVTKLLELNKSGLLTIKEVDGSIDAWDGITTGEYAMFFEGPWYFGAYDEEAQTGIVPALIPTYNGQSASVVGGENIVVFETTEYKNEAYEFAKFMTSEEVQLAMLEVGQLPVLKSLVSNSAVTDNPVWSVYMKQLESAHARISSPNKSDIEDAWKDSMTKIFVEGADVKTELQNLAVTIDGLLAE
jgi:multiple sugar transport system substrate-binding protein